MLHRSRVMLTAAVIAAILPSVRAHAQAGIRRKIPPIDELLFAPVPAPSCQEILRKSATPAADAPIEELIVFWASARVSGGGGSFSVDDPAWKPPVMEPAALTRLLEAAKDHPRVLVSILGFLNKEHAAQVAAVFQKTIAGDWKDIPQEWQEDWSSYVRMWLIHNGGLHEELLKSVAELTIDEKNFNVTNDLEYLAIQDWPSAKPFAEKLITQSDPHAAAAGLCLFYRFGDDEGAAKKLKAIAEDKKARGTIRREAIEALTSKKWNGRDEWFLSLFSDAEITNERDPFRWILFREADYWIPRVAKLVGGPDKAAHNNAVAQLAYFTMHRARVDAMLPLLPWLSDENWSTSDKRSWLIESLTKVDIPQCVPGARALLQDENSRSDAAYALERYHPKEAAADLRAAFEKEKLDGCVSALAGALAACGGVPDDEAAEAIEAYARKLDDWERGEERSRRYDFKSDKKIVLAAFGWKHLVHQTGVAQRLLKRIDALAADKETAAWLIEMLKESKAPGVDEYFIARLEKSIDLPTLFAAVDRRETLAKNPALAALIAKGGEAAGIAAGIIGGETAAKLFASNDRAAIRAAFAAARLGRVTIPLEPIAKLLESKDAAIGAAADAYLIAIDTPASRALVFARHPNEALILGPQGINYYGDIREYTEYAGDFTKKIRQRILEKDGPDEIFAMLSFGGFGGAGDLYIEIKGKEIAVRFVSDGGETTLVRKGNEKELQLLRNIVQKYNCDDLPPLEQFVLDGVQFTYIHLTKAGGRQLFMNNPGMSSSSGSVYDILSTTLNQWTRHEDFKPQ